MSDATGTREGRRAAAAPPSPALSLRPIEAGDAPFLRALYGSTREAELALTGWNEAQKEALVAMQFEAQHRYYQEHYAGASFDLVMVGGEPIGRLYVARWEDQIRVIDISLLPAWRGRGLGSRLLGALFDEGRGAALPVTIHVERFNPALRLYERLGFRAIGEHGVYWLMRREP